MLSICCYLSDKTILTTYLTPFVDLFTEKIKHPSFVFLQKGCKQKM